MKIINDIILDITFADTRHVHNNTL
jgi:hypothetical protein